jgi:putative peptidoglycan lipid II flippase
LNLAWTIEQVPETILGTAIAVAILPSLAEFINRGQVSEFTLTVNRALKVMLAFCLPAAALLAVTVRPLAGAVFNYDAARLDLLTACTWAFLIGLVGDTWLEVAVRSFYANQNTRTPLVAAFLQALSFVILSLVLTPVLGLAGIPLAAAITFTTQAVILLSLLNRRFPGLLRMGSTAWRAPLSAAAGGGLALALFSLLPLSPLPASLAALALGGGAALPFIWPEARLILRL